MTITTTQIKVAWRFFLEVEFSVLKPSNTRPHSRLCFPIMSPFCYNSQMLGFFKGPDLAEKRRFFLSKFACRHREMNAVCFLFISLGGSGDPALFSVKFGNGLDSTL